MGATANATDLDPFRVIAIPDVEYALRELAKLNDAEATTDENKLSIDLVRRHLESFITDLRGRDRYAERVKQLSAWFREFLQPCDPTEATHALTTPQVVEMLEEHRPGEYDRHVMRDILVALGGKERFVDDQFLWHLRVVDSAVL